MNDQELEALMQDLESERAERKASLSHPEQVAEAICAFANDLPNHRVPGVVFIGVTDDCRCANIRVTDDMLRVLSDMRSNGNIHPFPTMTVQKKVLVGCEMAIVIVEPSDFPPVRYKGRVCIRVGPRRGVATSEEERRLIEKRRSKDLPFELHPTGAASIDDLDTDWFQRTYLPLVLPPELLARNSRSVEQQLGSLRFLGHDESPTVLGILVLGKDPRQFIPGAYVQFLRIRGTDSVADPILDQKEIGGPLGDLLRVMDEVLVAHVSVASDIRAQPVEMRTPDYPIVALQQLARNAVQHRVYEGTNAPARITWLEDRIEIQNPGGPFGQVTRDNFGNPGVADYRNPGLSEVMKNLGYVQRFGFGIELARRELQKNGNPPLQFTIEETQILVTIRRRT